jgi:hypothetical protein
VPNEAGKADRAAVDQGHSPPAAVDPERGVDGGDPQVTPHGELQATGHGVALDRGDGRLGQHHAGRAHRPGQRHVLLDPVTSPFAHRLEVGAGAERATGPGEDGDVQIFIGNENVADELRSFGIVVASYGVGNKVTGLVGIVGPRRMQYDRSISSVRYMSQLVSDLMGELYYRA